MRPEVRRLLKLIATDANSRMGSRADVDTVKATFGPDYEESFGDLVALGFVLTEGPMGTITLSRRAFDEANEP